MPVEFARRQVENAKANEPAKLHFGSREPLPMDTPFHTDVDELEQEREILAKVRTRKSIYDAMQTMEYQINSNRVSNGQTPFVTVGFGLGTDWFAREVQRAILLNRIRGLGKDHHTAIFPKLVFTVRHGVNADPGDPNYDLKQLALECATKRMYRTSCSTRTSSRSPAPSRRRWAAAPSCRAGSTPRPARTRRMAA